MKNRRIIVASLPLTLALTMAVPPLAFATPKPPQRGEPEVRRRSEGTQRRGLHCPRRVQDR